MQAYDAVPTVLQNADVSPPETLGRLKRVRRLGAGGFASVWLYRDEELDSLVAVKLLADNWAQDLGLRERFLAEARMLRRVDSDHVVRVYDVGVTDDEAPYFVMTYADRGSVADLLGPAMDVAETLELVVQAAAGLAMLHRHGIVHRDVTPNNLLLRSEPSGEGARLLVADLGVAKALAHASGLTQVVGTPAYMAPEQADPTAGIDARADVHALGAVAYRLLTGRPVRTGGIASLAAAVPPPPPSQLAAVPPAVDDVILIACNPDRDARWPDVSTFAAQLQRAVEQPRTAVYPAASTPGEHMVEPESDAPSKTVPRWLVPAALVVFALTFALGWWLVGR